MKHNQFQSIIDKLEEYSDYLHIEKDFNQLMSESKFDEATELGASIVDDENIDNIRHHIQSYKWSC